MKEVKVMFDNKLKGQIKLLINVYFIQIMANQKQYIDKNIHQH